MSLILSVVHAVPSNLELYLDDGGPNRLLVRANEHLNAQSPTSSTAALHYIHSMLRSVLCVKIIYIYIYVGLFRRDFAHVGALFRVASSV